MVGGNLTFYSKYLYFKPYSDNDLKKLLKIEEVQPVKNVDLEKLIELSGGHYQLLNILLNSQKQQNPSLDQFVKLQLKELVNYLDYHQRKTLQKIALGKHIDEVDEYLLGVGMVKKTTSGYQLFTPLLTEYIKTNLPVKLALADNPEVASDWALDALIYRLRKHPFIKTHGYIIESHKKVGYTLMQT